MTFVPSSVIMLSPHDITSCLKHTQFRVLPHCKVVFHLQTPAVISFAWNTVPLTTGGHWSFIPIPLPLWHTRASRPHHLCRRRTCFHHDQRAAMRLRAAHSPLACVLSETVTVNLCFPTDLWSVYRIVLNAYLCMNEWKIEWLHRF